MNELYLPDTSQNQEPDTVHSSPAPSVDPDLMNIFYAFSDSDTSYVPDGDSDSEESHPIPTAMAYSSIEVSHCSPSILERPFMEWMTASRAQVKQTMIFMVIEFRLSIRTQKELSNHWLENYNNVSSFSKISERHLLEEKNAALVSYDNANYVIATDNDNNKPGTSLLRVDLSPERKDEFQISDFVSDNDDDSIKDPYK
ncbi:unnamed protein product [Diabrotica balteata]|uniref:Uncharacterized protein n=1 Tax=Diabrotica balteata TaxID=107213 RepID=A0A9N9T7P5_DIABA|nr:unnamed protein product [Diabrotica balteata]